MSSMNPLNEKPETQRHLYLKEADYSRNLLEIPPVFKKKLYEKLFFLYGRESSAQYLEELERLLKVHWAHKTEDMIASDNNFTPAERFSEKDVILITYGDLIKSPREKPLRVFKEFSEKFLKNSINTIHILPFFPYSSDRGFSVTDFEEVNPELGSWEDIEELGKSFKLMFDGVFNHISSKSKWFKEYLNMNPEYKDYFIVFSTSNPISEDHLKLIVRPRTSEVLSKFNSLDGPKEVWTTFSKDQIDLNYKNPKVLMKMIDILLFYVRRGADIVRLDAVTYIWSELGTSCVHLKEAHTIIKLFRDILDIVAPKAAIITETNVPHKDNVTYFGNGYDEAQMVYNFALPPLVLHTFQTGDSTRLSEWASSLDHISATATYFNFLDSHDGVGVMASRGILTEEEIEKMSWKVLEHGGFISYKNNGDGTSSPYELNITWYSAINRFDADEEEDFQIKKFIASRSLALVIIGVPGIYLHSFVGSKNDAEQVLMEERRSINRQTFEQESLFKALKSPESRPYKISNQYIRLIDIRIREAAFHPNSPQKILNLSTGVFGILRYTEEETEAVVAVTNISGVPEEYTIDLQDTAFSGNRIWKDLLTERKFTSEKGVIKLTLEAYDICWLKSRN